MTAEQFVSAHPERVRKRVLIVDDNPQVLHELRLFLETTGEVEIIGEASNGLEAIRIAQELNPDVVLMDLEMPIMDGYEATRQIKIHASSPRVVILSVHAGLEEPNKAYLAGADGFIVKGASYEALLGTVLGKL